MMYQKTGYQKNYYQPRKPVKSFQDLEVYQKALAICVAVVKRINPDVIASDPLSSRAKRSNLAVAALPRNDILEKVVSKLTEHLLELPVLIASAHSIRFSYPDEAVKRLEEVMLKCNLSIVYLEQYRDLRKIQDPGSGARPQGRIRDLEPIEPEFFEEQIRNLLTCRMKTMHLQMSWKKFFAEKKT